MWHTLEVSQISHARRTKKPACMACRKAKRKCGSTLSCERWNERSQFAEDKVQETQPTSDYHYAGLDPLGSAPQPSESTIYTHRDPWRQGITTDQEAYRGSKNPYLFYAPYQTEGMSSGFEMHQSDRSQPSLSPMRDGVSSQQPSHAGAGYTSDWAIGRPLTHIAFLGSQANAQGDLCQHMHTIEEGEWRSTPGLGLVPGLPHESQVSHDGQEWLEAFASSLLPRASALNATGASAAHRPFSPTKYLCKDEDKGSEVQDEDDFKENRRGKPTTARAAATNTPSSSATQGSFVASRTVVAAAASALVNAGDLMERAFDGLCSGIANMRLHDRVDPDRADFIANGIKYLFALSGGSFASPRFVDALQEAARPMHTKRRKVHPAQLSHDLTHRRKAVDELLAAHATPKSSEDWVLELLRTPGSAGAYFAISSRVNLVEKIIFNPLMETLFTTVDELSSAAYQLRNLNSFTMARLMHPECICDFYAAMIRCLGTSDVGSELEGSCLVQMYTRQGSLLPCLATVRWHWDEGQSLVSMRFWPMSNLMDPRLGVEPPPEQPASSLDPVITRMVEVGLPSPSSSSSCSSLDNSTASSSRGEALPCRSPPLAPQKSHSADPVRASSAQPLEVGFEPGGEGASEKKDAPVADALDDEVLQVLRSFLPEFQ